MFLARTSEIVHKVDLSRNDEITFVKEATIFSKKNIL